MSSGSTHLTQYFFWAEVRKYRDAANINPFSDICDLALAVLSLPHSNADVKRVFSQMNTVKSKPRNRMSLTTLNAILRVRYGPVGKPCYNHNLPESVLEVIGSTAAYSFKTQACTSVSIQEESDFCVVFGVWMVYFLSFHSYMINVLLLY